MAEFSNQCIFTDAQPLSKLPLFYVCFLQRLAYISIIFVHVAPLSGALYNAPLLSFFGVVLVVSNLKKREIFGINTPFFIIQT